MFLLHFRCFNFNQQCCSAARLPFMLRVKQKRKIINKKEITKCTYYRLKIEKKLRQLFSSKHLFFNFNILKLSFEKHKIIQNSLLNKIPFLQDYPYLLQLNVHKTTNLKFTEQTKILFRKRSCQFYSS